MEPEVVAASHGAAAALGALAAGLVAGAALVVRARLQARGKRELSQIPMFLVVGACAVAGLLSSLILFSITTSRALYLRPERVELVERRLWGERVSASVPRSSVTRVFFSRWTSSGNRNAKISGATLYFETRQAPREAAIDAPGGQGEQAARSIAERLGVPLVLLPR